MIEALELTEEKVRRIRMEWEHQLNTMLKLEGEGVEEPIRVEASDSFVYAFGSRAACHMLAFVYRRTPDRYMCGYSKPLKSWYFRFEVGS